MDSATLALSKAMGVEKVQRSVESQDAADDVLPAGEGGEQVEVGEHSTDDGLPRALGRTVDDALHNIVSMLVLQKMEERGVHRGEGGLVEG
jgi:hypothetical protein